MSAHDLAQAQYYAAMHEICTLAPSLRICDSCRFAPVAFSADDVPLIDKALSSEGVDALLVHPEGDDLGESGTETRTYLLGL